MLRKIVAALVLVPLAVIIIAFAVANRQIVTLSLDPFGGSEPAVSVTLPLFALIILVLIAGVLIGGAAAWLRQGNWRRDARRLEREVRDLRRKIDTIGAAGEPGIIAQQGSPPERLRLKSPVP